MPSLKQQQLDELKKEFPFIKYDSNFNGCSLEEAISQSLDKIIETAKGCLPDELDTSLEDEGNGFDKCRQEFLSNFKQRVEK